MSTTINHGQIAKVEENGDVNVFYPKTFSQDVYVNSNKKTLESFLGTENISTIGDGTVTGAITQLNSKSSFTNPYFGMIHIFYDTSVITLTATPQQRAEVYPFGPEKVIEHDCCLFIDILTYGVGIGHGIPRYTWVLYKNGVEYANIAIPFFLNSQYTDSSTHRMFDGIFRVGDRLTSGLYLSCSESCTWTSANPLDCGCLGVFVHAIEVQGV